MVRLAVTAWACPVAPTTAAYMAVGQPHQHRARDDPAQALVAVARGQDGEGGAAADPLHLDAQQQGKGMLFGQQ